LKREFVVYKGSTIHYSRFGTGGKWLFCFHGYGEEGSSFYILEESLGKEYTLIAIDMPFHGTTEWKDELLITTADLTAIIDSIIGASENLISLIGYSMGGRIALSLLETIPERIERVVLLAPDGLHINFWHWLSTRTKVGSRIFRYTVNKPQILFSMMRLSNKVGILNKSIYKFTHYYLEEEESRLLLFKRWTTMRRLTAEIHRLKDVIYQYRIPVRLLFGAYDKIILHKRARYFAEGIEELVTINIIETGHQLLKHKNADIIASLFYE
jgi:pimeloyl-ACP methyl ester carboxylesterase